MPLKHLNITISGRVQGVWFRKHTETKAIELGVHGFVANKENGNVYVEVEGEPATLDTFVAWCYIGSPFSSVKNVKCEESELKNFTHFEIK